MPLNVGTVTTARMSFGPATIAVGAAGATPTTDIGSILPDDGVELEFQAEMSDIVVGNPKVPVYRFAKSHNFYVRATSIEWNANNLAFALGTGATAISGSNEVYRFGGDPCPDELAVLVQHRKCTAAHTINVRVWRAQSETGGLAVTLGEEVHGFPYAWKANRSTTNWAGASLAADSQLVEVDIQLT